ncbi:MAG: TIGR00730 family Rossman fold protein [Legionellaceae bacterium]|nr:TIGR00730 family Rossman fold protein [Legionellaceae bacterium]
MKHVCVYLGANFSLDKTLEEKVVQLGNHIHQMDLTLVYGGSSLGMMGLLARTVKEQGGRVVGVITEHLVDKEKPLKTLDTLHVVNSMQDRKKMMQDLSDVFIVMPGGLGTLEEAIETWNSIKIGEIQKRIGFLNVGGYFDHLFAFMDHCHGQGFVMKEHTLIPAIYDDVQALMGALLE